MSSTAPAKAVRHSGPVFIVMGLLLLGLYGVAVLAQISTTEAAVGWGGNVSIWQPSWTILLQPLKFFGWTGTMSAQEGSAAFVGWAVELLYTCFVFVGFELVMHAVNRGGKFWGKVFIVCAGAGVLYNAANDYNYGSLGSGQAGHIAFAVVMSAVVAFFGPIGLVCIENGWKHA